MGLGGPQRTHRSSDTSKHELFKSLSPHNTATRQVFFHNGRFHTLKEALRFYVQRDTNPVKWYLKDAHGKVDKFNDLPIALRVNFDTTDERLTCKAGERPTWSERDIDDVAAFLATLNDGYVLTTKQQRRAELEARTETNPKTILGSNLGAEL